VLITPALRTALAEHGIAATFPGLFSLPDNTVLEPPLSLKRMSAAFKLDMGAFSYAESGYYFGVKIGRYCSIGRNVQIGRGSHPIDWGSTSPLFYQHHKAVFDIELPAAVAFSTNAPSLHAVVTTIGNDVRIGDGALVSQGVTIGDGAIIEPRAVVAKDVPPFAIVAGNPGVITGLRFPPRLAARMQALAWWRYAFWDLASAPVAQPMKFLDHVKKQMDEGMQPYAPEPITLSKFKNFPQS
jgi:acetyltransferase-like isoleucine patch superfamily enzyme